MASSITASSITASCEIKRVKDNPDVDFRHAGCGVVVGNKLYLWGGISRERVTFISSDSEDSDEEEEDSDQPPQPDIYRPVTLPKPSDSNHPFDVFDLTSLTWSKQNTKGDITTNVPSVGIGSALAYHKVTNSIYLYGGWNEENFSSDMFCVPIDAQWEWEKIEIPEGEIKPSPRYRTDMLVYGDKLCHFGGVGLEIVHGQDKGAKFDFYSDKKYGWNNEYYEFDVIKKKWEVPLYGIDSEHGRPPYNCGHTFTRFDSHRAIYFGGSLELKRNDYIYIFDLEKKEFQGPLQLDVKPPYRTFTTLCPLVDPDMVGESLCPGGPPVEQTLLLLWGKKSPNLILKDCWLCHCEDMSWTKIDLEDEVERYWHIACSYFCHPGKSTEVQVVIYGGAKRDPSVAETQFIGMGDLMILSFGTKTLKNTCLSVIASALHNSGQADPSLLCDQLPDSIPTAIKHSIATAYKAHVLTAVADLIN